MDAERIARKLEPLIPEQVGHWLHARDVADPELRLLIDKQIASVARQKLGDHRNKLLLSLPPERIASGRFHIGTVNYDGARWPFGVAQRDLIQHLGIFGRSGSGKTNLGLLLLKQLTEQKIPWLYFDVKRSARDVLPLLHRKVNIYTPGRSLSPLAFNPFIVPPGLETAEYVNYLVDVITQAFTLGDGAQRILQQAFSACYASRETAPTIHDLVKAVHAIPDKERVKGWKISALKALESVEFSNVASQSRSSQETLTRQMLHGHTVIELDGLGHSARKLLAPLLCLWLYSVQLGSGRREQLNFVIFLEEGHHYVYRQEKRAKETLMNVLLRQARELGIGFVVLDQHIHLISSACLGNIFSSLCLNQKDPTDINKAAAMSLLGEGEKTWLSRLKVGQAVVKLQERWSRPFLIQIPHLKFQKGLVTDAMLRGYLNGFLTHSALRAVLRQEIGDLGRIRLSDRGPSDDEVSFLNDVLAYPQSAVRDRYQRLQWSADKGHRIKSRLLHAGVVEEEQVKLGRTRKTVVRISHEGRTQLGILGKEIDKTSLAHAYWQRHYTELYANRGYKVAMEVPRRVGKTDIVASNVFERVAIEIETGKSDVVHNVKQDLLAGYSTVIVIAIDANAMQLIDHALLRSQIFIPTRVNVIIAGAAL